MDTNELNTPGEFMFKKGSFNRFSHVIVCHFTRKRTRDETEKTKGGHKGNTKQYCSIGRDTTDWNKFGGGGEFWGDGLERNFWEERLPLCVQSKFECLHKCCGHNILGQLVLVRDYSNADLMLAATTAAAATPLLMNPVSMTSKPNAGGGGKDCVKGKAEEAVHNFVHAEKATTNSFTDKGK